MESGILSPLLGPMDSHVVDSGKKRSDTNLGYPSLVTKDFAASMQASVPLDGVMGVMVHKGHTVQEIVRYHLCIPIPRADCTVQYMVLEVT